MEDKLQGDLTASVEAAKVARKEIERLKKSNKRKRFHGFTAVQQRTALVLYVSGGFDKNPAVYYILRHLLGSVDTPTLEETEQLGRMVEDWFLAWPEAEVHALATETHPKDAAIFRKARSILCDHALKGWVFSMNITKGLAPPVRDVALKWTELADKHDVLRMDSMDSDRSDLSKNKHRKYFINWRKRMHIKVGKIQTRELMSRIEIQEKVILSFLGSSLYVLAPAPP